MARTMINKQVNSDGTVVTVKLSLNQSSPYEVDMANVLAKSCLFTYPADINIKFELCFWPHN